MLKFSSSDSLSSKASLLDVSAALKASFLGGLVEVGGSAKYLRNTKSSNQQSRATIHYSEPQDSSKLTMTQLGKITYLRCLTRKLQLMWSRLCCTELRPSWCLIAHLQKVKTSRRLRGN
ncbi:hypothetical protein QQF64_033866 [Cirrhinus molitorella]|uniref:Uncharacterized protein n=1 Tax=Cirrhinus molitorella TaxID=172907 RepID=A0ABR3MV35_9TELE